RWHPAGEAPVPPSTFIPLAEDAGLISALGQLVLEKVCFQIAAWRRFGLPFGHVALNLSPKQLEEPGFLASLDDTMQRFGIDPRWLALEITESAYAADDQVMAALLDSFRERRIAVSLDDFGTGYSSLGRLQGLAFTTLKIDQIFIGRVDGSNTGYHVVQAIINLAHVLGMKVVAEGVETAGQLEALKRLGCDQMQGYYFSRPMPADAVPEFIEKMLSERFSTAHAPTPAELPWRQPHALLAAGAEAAPTDARYRARAIL
ncbi:MAG TPA: EAL domain-containing protein, partial [Acidobacteriaceae bacterium]